MSDNKVDLYDEFAQNWWDPGTKFHALQELNKPRFEYFDQFVRDWTGYKVLDVGCGGGFTSELITKRGGQVSGVDPSAVLIKTAQEHARANGLNIDYRVAVAEALPFEDKTFDAVICVDVLEHVHNLQAAIAEIYRVSKPGALFLFDTINRTIKSKMIMIWMLENIAKEIPKGVHEWKKFIKPKELTSLLRGSNFGDLELKGLDIKGRDKATGHFKAELNDNMSVMYIGKCVKPNGDKTQWTHSMPK